MFTTTATLKHDVQPCWLGCALLPNGGRIAAGTEIGVKQIGQGLWEVLTGPHRGMWISESFLSFDIA